MARVNIGAKPYINPMPVLMLSSYDEDGKPCAMLAVWGGVSNEKEITITVASQRNTLKGILSRCAFVVSMADEANEVACDFLGITPGSHVPNKFRPLAYDWMSKVYFSVGPKVGNAYRDGLALKSIV